MPSQIDFFEEDVSSWLAQGLNRQEIIDKLAQVGCSVGLRTLQNRIKDWGIPTRARPITDEPIIEAIVHLYNHEKLSDTKIAERISSRFSTAVSVKQVKTLRLERRLLRRYGPENRETAEAHNHLTAQLMEPILDAAGRSWGYRWLTNHLRSTVGHRANRDFVAAYQKARDPARVDARNVRNAPNPLNHRGNFVTPGPNFMWCVDGHDKLAPFGIQIYAAIDAYSRRLLWFYVGNANRSQLCVLKQYLDIIEALGACPSLIRADFSAEAMLMAVVQFYFYI
jgi:hypothetical protein